MNFGAEINLLIEKYMFSENIFQGDLKSYMGKALAPLS